jgi:hypothetical protein
MDAPRRRQTTEVERLLRDAEAALGADDGDAAALALAVRSQVLLFAGWQ